MIKIPQLCVQNLFVLLLFLKVYCFRKDRMVVDVHGKLEQNRIEYSIDTVNIHSENQFSNSLATTSITSMKY